MKMEGRGKGRTRRTLLGLGLLCAIMINREGMAQETTNAMLNDTSIT